MMYQDIYSCICQKTKKNEDTSSSMSNLQHCLIFIVSLGLNEYTWSVILYSEINRKINQKAIL